MFSPRLRAVCIAISVSVCGSSARPRRARRCPWCRRSPTSCSASPTAARRLSSNRFTELTGKHMALMETFFGWGNSAQQGLRTLARNADPAGRRDLDPERPDAGRDHHARADRPRRRRRLPAAAEQLLRDPQPARLHPAAGRAEPLPERLGGGRMRRHAERRRTQRLLVQDGLPADRRDHARRASLEGIERDARANSGCRASHRTKGANPEALPVAPVSIIWSPLPAGSPRVKGNFPGNYWPGSKWVDWVGTDFYAKYPVWEDLNRFYEGAQWKRQAGRDHRVGESRKTTNRNSSSS